MKSIPPSTRDAPRVTCLQAAGGSLLQEMPRLTFAPSRVASADPPDQG